MDMGNPDHGGKTIQIEMYSPYADYASYITGISVGERDISILQFVEHASIDILCAAIILFKGLRDGLQGK